MTSDDTSDPIDSLACYYGKVYKYRGINTHDQEQDEIRVRNDKKEESRTTRERLKDLISENLIYAASPSDLNDPFECLPHTPLKSRDGFDRALKREVFKQGRQSSRNDRRQREKSVRRKLSSEGYRQKSIASLIDRENAIISFSKKWDSLTQWAYYASEHKGICLEFEIVDGAPWWDRSIFKGPRFAGFEVIYRQDRPEFDISKALSESKDFSGQCRYAERAGLSAIVSKSEQWSGEQEVRLIAKKSGPLKFPASALTGVYLGCRIGREEEKFVIDCVKKSKSAPTVYKCEKSLSEYVLKRIVKHLT